MNDNPERAQNKRCAAGHELEWDKNYCPIIIDDPTHPEYGQRCGQPMKKVGDRF